MPANAQSFLAEAAFETFLAALKGLEDRLGTRSESAQTTGPAKERRSRKGSLASAIREIGATHLRNKKARAKSSEIYQVVLDAGITVPGQKPVSVVSSSLSSTSSSVAVETGRTN